MTMKHSNLPICRCFFLAVALTLAHCRVPEFGCICTMQYDPVCGSNGKTYSNSCVAECAGVTKYSKGACSGYGEIPIDPYEEPESPAPEAEECVCDGLLYKPVCGSDRKTYNSTCAASCAGVEVKSEGECPCRCPRNYDPVCGMDGVTYANRCLADCKNVMVDVIGPCPCPCPLNLAPVCGKDGLTYDNSCLAKCKGVEIANDAGPC